MDFFCGAGGFSEGFRQKGFEIVLGIDNWEPATKTFNHNFGLACNPRDILDHEGPLKKIEELPDTDVIVGSPPCVSFSMSNKFGNADKALGIRLVKVFLRIVAVKKYKRGSKLKAWYMENVPQTFKYLKPRYSFRDLSLSEWAEQNGYQPKDIAVTIKGHHKVIDAADYGVPQHRKRLFVGEIVRRKSHPFPGTIHSGLHSRKGIKDHVTLRVVREGFPSPYNKKSRAKIRDPNYPTISLPQLKVTDHFYDTGVHEIYWRDNRYKKLNHPYMGRMSFPERLDKSSRTVVATNFPRARESLIYECELQRRGNGQYRTPTVREAAVLMSFPITYQFSGVESTKWKLVGNAVCPLVSAALATRVREVLGLTRIRKPRLVKEPILEGVHNLNTYRTKRFLAVPLRNKGSRFRRHPFKDGNMAVSLTNYDIEASKNGIAGWRVTVTYGIGKGFGVQRIDGRQLNKLERVIRDNFPDGQKFVKRINNGFSEMIAPGKALQMMYEQHRRMGQYYGPVELIAMVAKLANKYGKHETYNQDGTKIFRKDTVPKKQLYALYAMTKIATIANNSR